MKKKYQIVIEDTHKHEFINTLKMLGIEFKLNSRGESDTNGRLIMFTEAIVELTKYELLFLRLVCSSGEFRKVFE